MKILVVDDSKLIREAIANELRNAGYEILACSSGNEAVELYRSDSNIALITLDVNMDGIDGFETLRQIRHLDKECDAAVPVIFVTGNDNIDDRSRGFELGAQDFVTKPFFRGQILAKVNHILKPSDDLKGTKILVVDDNEVARYIISRTLNEVGAETVEAANGDDAFDLMKQQEFDMAIVDLLMPGIGGDELCRMIREQLGLKDIPLIILSAFTERSHMLDIFRSGATDYIFKPFIKEELVARLFVHFERSRAVRLLRTTLIEKENLINKSDYLIGKLKDANTRLQETQRELVAAERRNAILALSVTANHEINQPLMVIKGNIELLESQIPESEKGERHVTRIHEAIDRIESILNKLRNLTGERENLIEYSNASKMYDLEATETELLKKEIESGVFDKL